MRAPSVPVAALGRERRVEINRRLGLRGDETLVLMGLGGVAMRPPLEAWPEFPGVRWLTPPDWDVTRPDMASWAELGDCSMLDLIRSSDVLFTKTRLWRVHRGGLQRNAGALRRTRRLAGRTVAERLAGGAGQRRQNQPPAINNRRTD